MEGRRRRRGAAAVPRRMVPSSSDHRPRIRRRCRSRRGCRRRRRRPGAGAAGRGYARRLVIRTGGSGRCRLGVDRRVDRWLAARPRRVRRGSRGCGDRRSRSRRPGRGPWWDVSGGMDADGQRWSESGLDARRGGPIGEGANDGKDWPCFGVAGFSDRRRGQIARRRGRRGDTIRDGGALTCFEGPCSSRCHARFRVNRDATRRDRSVPGATRGASVMR